MSKTMRRSFFIQIYLTNLFRDRCRHYMEQLRRRLGID